MDLSYLKIETERLLLVPISMEYKEDIFREFRGDVIKYMFAPAPDTIEDIEKLIKKWRRQLKNGTRLFMGITKKDSGEFLGCAALEDINKKNPEAGGWLKKSAHGEHYGQEAIAALKNWADENLEYDCIIWPCAEVNLASRKVAESLGGKVIKKYEKKNGKREIYSYVEYRIPKNT